MALLYRMGTGNGSGGDEPTGKLVVNAEAGSIVHLLNIETSVETTKEAIGNTVSFIVEAGEIYEVWMTKTGQESGHVTTPAITMLVTIVSLAYWKANIKVTVPDGATATISNGSESYDITVTTTQEVHTKGTWNFECKLDNVSAITYKLDGNNTTTRSKSIAVDGSTTNVDFSASYGFLNVTTSSDFDATAQITLKNSASSTVATKTPTNHTVKFTIATAGKYTAYATATDGQSYPSDVTQVDLGATANVTIYTKAKMVSWSNGTDAEIANMLDSYYNGRYTNEDILNIKNNYWRVGDKRTIHLDAMSNTGVSESHHADDYEFVILDHEHDNLVTPINGKTKAFITVQQDRILYKNVTDNSYNSTYPTAAEEGGYMNDSTSSVGGWDESARRTWCNSIYKNALPSTIQSLIKTVKKLTLKQSGSTSELFTSNDNIFLPSEIEITGSSTNSLAGEGFKYEYYNIESNVYKKPTYQTNPSAHWRLRSPANATTKNMFCYYDGAQKNVQTWRMAVNSTLGISPAFCM